MEHGIVKDWNDMERIWQYVYSKDQLQTFSEEVRPMCTDPSPGLHKAKTTTKGVLQCQAPDHLLSTFEFNPYAIPIKSRWSCCHSSQKGMKVQRSQVTKEPSDQGKMWCRHIEVSRGGRVFFALQRKEKSTFHIKIKGSGWPARWH